MERKLRGKMEGKREVRKVMLLFASVLENYSCQQFLKTHITSFLFSLFNPFSEQKSEQ